MKNWMKKLASHYENTRRACPKRKLAILFDIDGTILDMRHMILDVLKSYDDINGTCFFDTLKFKDIGVHENQVAKLLKKLMISGYDSKEIMKWYNQYRWSTDAILTSHRPFLGVMEVIRWFQMQPNTFVALNTGRPEALRSATLRSLNK